MKSCFKLVQTFLIAIIASRATAEREQLTIEEARIRVNKIPLGLQNVVAYVTNEVQLRAIPTDNSNNRIIGGTGTTIEKFPHQISLQYREEHICGGSIISEQWVLTAAHCLDWYPQNSDLSVRSGSTYLSSGGTIHSVFYYHIHEQYKVDEYPYDVATVRVQIPFDESARAIIPLAVSEWLEGTNVTVTGWGKIEQNLYPNQLYMVTLPAVNRAMCNITWSGQITGDMICAGDIGLDSCDGDSGGPAIQGGVQFGIVSWGALTCGLEMPGVYTNIVHPSIRSFIKRTARI